MSTPDLLRLLEIVAWPVVALAALLVIRPHLSALFSGATIKLSVFGQSIETTLPELKEILEDQAEEALSPQHVEYLESLKKHGARPYGTGVKDSAQRKFLRPLRNSGLVLTVPRNSFLSEATAIEISALGRLYLRARNQK
jgi:hypothetical protein